MMIDSAIRLENAMPITVSMRMRRNSPSASLSLLTSGSLSSSMRCSSASCDACQKNRYGEIVVPRIATSVVRKAAFHSTRGTAMPVSASLHCTSVTASAAT